MVQRIFPIIIMTLQSFAGSVYLSQGDWKRAIIWFGAAIMNVGIIIV